MNQFQIWFYIAIIIAGGSCNSFLNYEDEDNTTELIKCVTDLANHIKTYSTYNHIGLMNVNEVIAKALHNIQGLLFISRTSSWYNDYLSTPVYIIVSQDYDDLHKNINVLIRDVYWNPRAKYIIVVEKLSERLQSVADLLVRNNIFNVTVIGKVKDVYYDIHSFNLKLDSCNRPHTLQFISKCSKYNVKTRVYRVPRQLKARGCHVKIIAQEFVPYVSFDPNFMGIELSLIVAITKYEGINFEVIKLSGKGQHGKYVNDSYTGILHRVETYEVEGAIGAYYMSTNRIRLLDFSYPYAVDHTIIVVARSRYLSIWNAVRVLLATEDKIGLLLLFAAFSAAAIMMSIFPKIGTDISRNILIVFGYLCSNVSITRINARIPQRIIVIDMLLYAICITSILQACLLTQETSPLRDYQVKLKEEVIKDYQQIEADQFGYDSSETGQKSVCHSIMDCIIQIKQRKDERLYTVTSNAIYDYFDWKLNANKGNDEDLYKLKESVGTLLQTMYFRRGSTLLPIVTKRIERLISSGILRRMFIKFRVPKNMRKRYNDIWFPIKLEYIYDIFYILVAGGCLSVITFICEIIFKMYTKYKHHV